MSKTALFNSLKSNLMSINGIKHVALWNNQLERESEEQPFLYPAVFIEFLTSNYTDKGNLGKFQQYQMTVRLHICFESYLDEDITILDLTEQVWNNVHGKQYGDFGKLLRRSEDKNYDHPNIQDYIQDYETLGQACLVPVVPTVSVLLDPILNPVTINTINELP